MASPMPCLTKQALKMLRLPLVSIQAEASISVYKQTRQPQQWAMSDDMHVARLSFTFNGPVVPPAQSGTVTLTKGCTRPPMRTKEQKNAKPVEDVIEETAKKADPKAASTQKQQESAAANESSQKRSRSASAQPKTKKAKQPDQLDAGSVATRINVDK